MKKHVKEKVNKHLKQLLDIVNDKKDFNNKIHTIYPIFKNDNKTINCYVLIDKSDVEKMKTWVWRLQGVGYIKCKINSKDNYLHRVISNEKNPSIIIDHINRNKLDNRRKNLRRGTLSQNSANRLKNTKIKSTSKYKGVSLSNGKWKVHIKHKGQRYNLGTFINEKEAAKQYNIYAKKFFGKFAALNII
jgi:hypothetical protein